MRFNKLVPELEVSDFKRSLDFYIKTLGFKIEYTREDFAFLSFQGSQLMIQKVNDAWSTGALEYPFGRGMNLQIEVDDIKPLLDSIGKSRIILFKEPTDNWYRKEDKLLGLREFLLQDPDGYLLRFSQSIGKRKLSESHSPDKSKKR